MNRLHRFTVVALTYLVALVLTSCGGNSGPVTPPDNSTQGTDSGPTLAEGNPLPVHPGTVLPLPAIPELTAEYIQPTDPRDDRILFGIWDIRLDPETREISIIPNRSLQSHWNVTALVLPPNCPECVKIQVLNIDPITFIYSFDITLKNPTLVLTGYDVRGTLLFPPGDNRELVNADDYTKLFDDSDPKDINPFIAFAKTAPLRAFGPEEEWTEQFDIRFPPPPNLVVTFVVDASHPDNQEEVYMIDNQYLFGGFNDCNSEEGWLFADIFDWQDNATGLTLDLTLIGGTVVDMEFVSGNTYRYFMNNSEYGTAAGFYDLLLTATSENAEYALYDYFRLDVVACANTPPAWDTTVGVVEVNSITGGLEVVYGTATDVDTPVIYNIYHSENYPIEWTTADFVNDADGSPAILDGLTDASTYWVGVRAIDALGNEEKNTIQMSGIPSNPPVWDSTIGVTGVTSMYNAVEVQYGTASDPQEPVTYNVYWYHDTPIDFDVADFKNDTGSPTMIDGLANFVPMYFAVRAIDAVGAEDENTNELECTPNGPPEWEGPLGIQSTIPGDGKVTVTYGTAIDIDLPIVYNIYYSDTWPLDFAGLTPEVDADGSPYTVEGLTNGLTYHFAVRAEDSIGTEEDNTVELPGTPDSAPTWLDDIVGVQDLIPFDHQVTVFYGQALDDDPPITYYIYWDVDPVIDFDDADFVTTTEESPHVVDSLPNYVPLQFAVRAEDGLGIMEQNTVQLTAIPNPAPEWDTTIGIQSLEPQNEALIAFYGTASDIDDPVIYRVYHSENPTIDFDLDPYIEDPDGSPTNIPGLTNGDTHYAAVRAVDSYDHEDQNTVTLPGVPFNLPTNQWTVHTGGVVQGSPSVADLNHDTILDVIIGDQSGKMVAYSGDTGAQIWQFPAGPPPWLDGWVDSSPALADLGGDSTLDVVFGVGAVENRVYCLDGATGEELWHADVGGGIISSPALANIVGDFHPDVIIGCMDGKIYALDGTDGSQHWAFPTGAGVFSSPAVADITLDLVPDVVVGSRDGYVYAIDGNAGTKIWDFPTYEWINSSPALVDLNLDLVPDAIVASMDGNVYALDGTDGSEIWSFPTGSYIWTSPAIARINNDPVPDVVLGADSSNVYAIDGALGTQIWSFPSNDRIWSSAALVELNGDIYPDAVVGSDDGYLYAIDGEDGSLLWAYPTGDWVDSSPAVCDIESNGIIDIVFGRYDGYLTLLSSNDSVVGSMPWQKFRRDLMNTGAY